MPRICGPGDQALGAEAAAQERTADMDVLRRDAEQSGDAPLRHRQTLARRIDRQTYRRPTPRRWHAAPSHCDTGSASRRSPRSASSPPRGPPRHRRGASRTGLPTPTAGRHETFAGVEADAGRLRLVSRRQQRGAFGRSLKRLGDHHRDRLVGVTHLVVLQQIEPEHEGMRLGVRILRQRRPVRRRHHLDHAGVALGGGDIEERDAAARDAG